MSDEPKRLQDDTRIVTLEERTDALHDTLHGNGSVGIDERLSNVEVAQRVNEDRRGEDKADSDKALEQLHASTERIRGSLDTMNSKLDMAVGGWKVFRGIAGWGAPFVLALLVWIVRQLFTLTGGP